MTIDKTNITFINGPGRHGAFIEDIIKYSFEKVISFNYYPFFERRVYDSGLTTLTQKSRIVNLTEKLTGGIEARIKLDNRWNEIIHYEVFDRIVSSEIGKSDLLFAWPQMSLHSIKKAVKFNSKVWLEFPIIHISEHQEILKSNYKKKNISNTFDVFPSFFEDKIIKEISSSTHINVLSNFAKESFLKHGIDEDKIILTPLGINTDDFSINLSIQKKEKFVILFSGRINYWKGIDILLKSFETLPQDFELWLAGPIQNEILPLFKKIDKRIKVLGIQSHKQLVSLYNQADIVILPSLQESFGLVILEAMSCGTPVIASKYCAGPDIITSEDFGYIINPIDIDDIKSSIIKAYNNIEKYRSIGNRIKLANYIKNNFSLSNYKKNLCSNINSILNT